MLAAILSGSRCEEYAAVFEAEQEQRDDGSQMQANDHQTPDYTEHR